MQAKKTLKVLQKVCGKKGKMRKEETRPNKMPTGEVKFTRKWNDFDEESGERAGESGLAL